jgi:hypothetical protein
LLYSTPTPVAKSIPTVVSDITLAIFTKTDTQPLSVPNPTSDPSTDVWDLAVAAQAQTSCDNIKGKRKTPHA